MRVNGHKETDTGRYIIQVYAVISVYNDMQQLICEFNENFVIIVVSAIKTTL